MQGQTYQRNPNGETIIYKRSFFFFSEKPFLGRRDSVYVAPPWWFFVHCRNSEDLSVWKNQILLCREEFGIRRDVQINFTFGPSGRCSERTPTLCLGRSYFLPFPFYVSLFNLVIEFPKGEKRFYFKESKITNKISTPLTLYPYYWFPCVDQCLSLCWSMTVDDQ